MLIEILPLLNESFGLAIVTKKSLLVRQSSTTSIVLPKFFIPLSKIIHLNIHWRERVEWLQPTGLRRECLPFIPVLKGVKKKYFYWAQFNRLNPTKLSWSWLLIENLEMIRLDLKWRSRINGLRSQGIEYILSELGWINSQMSSIQRLLKRK